MKSFNDIRPVLRRRIGQSLTENLYRQLQDLAAVRGQASGWGEVHCWHEGSSCYATVTFMRPILKDSRIEAYRRVTYVARYEEEGEGDEWIEPRAWWEETKAELHLKSGEWVRQSA